MASFLTSHEDFLKMTSYSLRKPYSRLVSLQAPSTLTGHTFASDWMGLSSGQGGPTLDVDSGYLPARLSPFPPDVVEG